MYKCVHAKSVRGTAVGNGVSEDNRVSAEEIRSTWDRQIYREIESCWQDETIPSTAAEAHHEYIIRAPLHERYQPLVIVSQDVRRIRSCSRFPCTLSVRPP